MTQPPRLRDHEDPELRELLRYAQGQGVPSSARVDALTARVLAELAGSAAEGTRSEASEAPGAASGAAGGAAIKWTLCVALALVAGWSAYRLFAEAGQERSAAPAAVKVAPVPARAVVQPVPAVAVPVAQVELIAPAPASEPAVRPDAPGERKRDLRVQLKARAAAQTTASSERGDPGAEVALLQRARSALAADPQAAFALASQHRREHPRGVFSEEREAIAVEALWRAGQGAQAQARLRALLRAFPRSTYRERLTALLARPSP